ncbi:MAG: DegT/DnrJ/EryC1/StrS family aminotransferase [Rhizobiaceae bacterium]|nr:DegT/DnrJ/EryC1/StrS family aminotransferase [Rhizobiaceae bacterium]
MPRPGSEPDTGSGYRQPRGRILANFIPVNTPRLSGREREYLLECIDTGWISSEGPFVGRFEEAFSAKVDRSYGIAVSNGTAAIDVAVAALGIGPGDEVILPTFTIISCAMQIVRAGATPVVVDCDPRTWNMRAEDAIAAITERTKAIMLVHIYGLPVDLGPILEVAREKGIAIIEDAAEMHGQTWNGKPCGSFGDISTFSFYANKNLTMGEGGMVVTDDPVLADRCRSFRNLCFLQQKRFVHEELGWNYRLTNVQAAIGMAQLEEMDTHITRKREVGRLYNRLLVNVPGLQLPVPATNYAENIYWVYAMVLDDDVPVDAEQMMKLLAGEGIGTRPFFWPLHEQPVFLNHGLFHGAHLPVAERISRRGFYLPSGLGLSDQDVELSAETLRRVLAGL